MSNAPRVVANVHTSRLFDPAPVESCSKAYDFFMGTVRPPAKLFGAVQRRSDPMSTWDAV